LWTVLFVIALIGAAAGWLYRVEITSASWWPDDFPRADGAHPAGEAKVAPDDRHRRTPRR
jgi:hypothetical protein